MEPTREPNPSPRRPAGVSEEEAALFNPAFISLLYARTIQGWNKESDDDMPLPIAFLAVGLCLHAPTRGQLPGNVSAKYVDWVQRNPDVRAQFPPSVQQLSPLLRSGLLFALGTRVCTLKSPASLVLGNGRPRAAIDGDSADVVSVQRSALFLGRWLSKSGDAASIFGLIGVRP
ncbi:three component ABC system middle component [Dactylosporangium sp. NPDC050688]|uniref:three component ABC system middle component n=1 Tax=Dactylosporangium sp. NPDC050688 TaxID=3157217 RepID=UPI0033D6DDBB